MERHVDARPFAIITGASRGIGREYAKALAERGYDLLMVARDRLLLQQLASDLMASYGINADWEEIDLAQPGSAHRVYAASRQRRSFIDVLVNNAGFGLYGRFVDMPLARLQDMVQLHIGTLVDSVRLFLPSMLEQQRGTIINVASEVGLMPVPYLSVYAATKAFVVAFSQGLAQEVKNEGVQIQVCCPGSTDTEFHARAGYVPKDPTGSSQPDAVVAASLSGMKKGTTLVMVGWKGSVVSVFSRVMPRRLLLSATSHFLKPRP